MAFSGLGLVTAVWLSLQLSGSAPAPRERPVPPAIIQLGDVPGFRSGAWYLPDDELLGFVEIPAGPFLMGSDATMDRGAFDIERWSDDNGRGTVDLPVFYISRYEVTVAQYRAFILATAYRVSDQEALRGSPDHPVVAVSWTDALAYTRWIETKLRGGAADAVSAWPTAA